MIDLGTQDITFKGEVKKQHKIQVSWELPHEKMEDGRPYTVHKRYTLSASKNGHLRADLESWRAQAYKDDEIAGIDLRRLVGVPAFLTITKNESDGKTYTNVETVSKLPKGTEVPSLYNDKVILSLDPGEFDQNAYGKLSQFLQDTIAKSPEYQAIKNGSAVSTNPQSNPDLDDEIPF